MKSLFQCCVFTIACVLLGSLLSSTCACALEDKDNQGRWTTPTKTGPDKDVPGFLVNLGPTGARGILTEKSFVVRYIFPGSPAVGRLKLGDEIVGAFGKPFASHRWGGSQLGYEGPVMDMGNAIEKAEGGDGKLALSVMRDAKPTEITVALSPIGSFSATFPFDCKKSALLRTKALSYLAEHHQDVSGGSHNRMTVALALLSSSDPKHNAAGKSMCLQWSKDAAVVRSNKTDPGNGTWTWDLSHQIITLGEYYLLSKDAAVLPTMQATSDLLKKSQYSGKISVWGPQGLKELTKVPFERVDAAQQLYDGGFGHTQYIPGFSQNGSGWGPNGYGPMQYPTILAVIAWQIADRCGVKVEDDRIKRALAFIHRGSNAAGHVAYGGEFAVSAFAGLSDPAKFKNSKRGDIYVGRSGAALIAHKLSPEYPDSIEYISSYRNFLRSAHESLPNGHADTNLGMLWGLLGSGASDDEATMRTMFDYYKAYFNMARCFDGSYVTQPGRDYADGGYYSSSRYHATANMALTYGFSDPKLMVQGIEMIIPGVNQKALTGKLLAAYKAMTKKEYAAVLRTTNSIKAVKTSSAGDVATCDALTKYIDGRFAERLATMSKMEQQGDMYGVKEVLDAVIKDYTGLEGMQEKIAHFQEGLKQDSWKESVRIGGEYNRVLAMLKRSKSKTTVRDLEQFAEKYPESLYGKWAALVAAEFSKSGVVIDP